MTEEVKEKPQYGTDALAAIGKHKNPVKRIAEQQEAAHGYGCLTHKDNALIPVTKSRLDAASALIDELESGILEAALYSVHAFTIDTTTKKLDEILDKIQQFREQQKAGEERV